MTTAINFVDRTARSLPSPGFAHWLLRAPLIVVLVQQGMDKFPLSPDAAAGFGVAYPLWIMAALGELAVALMLVVGGVSRGAMGDLLTRLAGAGAAAIVAGVIYVAYWAPPMDLILFNQFHILLMCAGLYLALSGKRSLT